MDFSFITDDAKRAEAEAAYATELETAAKAKADELAKASIDAATSGMKTKMEQLLDEKKKIQDALKNFEGVDPVKAKEAMALLKNNEKMKLMQEGKLEELLDKHTSQLIQDHETKLSELSKMLDNEKSQALTYKQKFESKIVEDSLRSAALAAGVRKEALDDVIMRGNMMFSLGTDGSVESRDGSGKLRKIGDIVANPSNWVESLKTTAPHFWPPSEGAGAMGSGDAASNDILEQMEAAAKAGNMVQYAKLRKQLMG